MAVPSSLGLSVTNNECQRLWHSCQIESGVCSQSVLLSQGVCFGLVARPRYSYKKSKKLPFWAIGAASNRIADTRIWFAITGLGNGSLFIGPSRRVYMDNRRPTSDPGTSLQPQKRRNRSRQYQISTLAHRQTPATTIAAMPSWRIYAHPDTFTPTQRATLAKDITDFYVNQINLPAFYVNVLFIPLEQNNFFIGGEPRKNFVRIAAEHIARIMPSPETQAGRDHRNGFMEAVNQVRCKNPSLAIDPPIPEKAYER